MRTLSRTTAMLAVLPLVVATTAVAVAQDEEADLAGESPQVILDWNINTLGATGTAGIAPAAVNLYLAMVHGAIYDAVNSISGT